MQSTAADRHQDIRDAVRALCADFPAEYHRKIDEERGYPDAFVHALTKAGWMAALIPEAYGGSGLGSVGATATGTDGASRPPSAALRTSAASPPDTTNSRSTSPQP